MNVSSVCIAFHYSPMPDVLVVYQCYSTNVAHRGHNDHQFHLRVHVGKIVITSDICITDYCIMQLVTTTEVPPLILRLLDGLRLCSIRAVL